MDIMCSLVRRFMIHASLGLVLASCWSGRVLAQAELQTLDLGKSVARGLAANPQMQSAREVLIGSEKGKLAALAAMGPVAKASYSASHQDKDPFTLATEPVTAPVGNTNVPLGLSYTRVQTGYRDTFNLDINIHQNLFTGFKLLSTYQKAALSKDQAQAQLKNAELTLVRTVQQAFLGLLKARADLKASEDSKLRLESQVKTSQAYFQLGLVPRLDVLQAQTDLDRVEQQIFASQGNIRVAEAQMNALLAFPMHVPIEYAGSLEYIPFSIPLESCLDSAYKNRPDMYVAIKSVEIAGKDTKIAAAPFYPQVAADADVIRTGNKWNVSGDNRFVFDYAYTQFTLSVSMQMWDWGNTLFSTQQAQANTRKLQADLASLRLTIRSSVQNFFFTMQQAGQRIGKAREGQKNAREAYAMATNRYKLQVGSYTDVLDAQSRMTNAESDMNQALYDYDTSLSNLYAAMGVLSPALRP